MSNLFWLLFQLFNSLSSSITGLFLSVYIWQKTGNLQFIYIYFLSLFVVIPVFGLIGSLISKKYSFKIAFLMSSLSSILFMYFIIKYPEMLISSPLLFGILNGLSVAFYAIPRNSLFQILNKENISSGNSILNSLGSIISLVVPTLGSFSIYYFSSYNFLFLISITSLFIGLIFMLFIKLPDFKNQFDIRFLKTFNKNNDFKKLMSLYFLNGVKGGIEWPLMGIILLNLIGGNLQNWGYLNSLSAFIGIVMGFVYSKFFSNRNDKALLYLSSILYSVFGMFLIVNFDLLNFAIFLLGTTITSSLIGPSFSKLANDVFVEVSSDDSNSSEFYFFTEVPLMLGRILSLGSLYALNVNLESKMVLGIIFFALSFLPLLSTYVIQKTSVFKVNNL